MCSEVIKINGIDVPVVSDKSGTRWVRLRDGLYFLFCEGDEWYVSRDEDMTESFQFRVEMLPTA